MAILVFGAITADELFNATERDLVQGRGYKVTPWNVLMPKLDMDRHSLENTK
jgi:hypothetical protein